MSNFVQRTIFGSIFVAVVVASILVGAHTFAAVFLPITILSVREYHKLMQSSRWLTFCASAAAGLLFFTIYNVLFGIYAAELFIPLCGVGYLLLIMAGILAELWLKAENPIRNWGNLLTSQVIIALPFALMLFLMYVSRYVLLAVFVLIWINDSGAYCVGSLMAKRPGGNHKMFPRVSPAKSWEGLIGGFVFAIAASLVLEYLGCFNRIHDANLYGYVVPVVFAITVSGFGTIGDLIESLTKRTIGVKDSGMFLPGHGGFLDRFDSVLLATPAVTLLVILLLLF